MLLEKVGCANYTGSEIGGGRDPFARDDILMQSDQELIDSANQGDARAFEALYYRYRDWVYRLAWRFTGSRDQALDVLQETFFYLLKKFPGFKLSCSMTTFLYPVVKHVSLAMRRKAGRTVSEDAAFAELPAPQTTDGRDSHSELAAVLSALRKEQREVLLMRFIDEMMFEEIAEALNIPVSTVKSRLYRGLEALRHDARTRNYFLD
ncbi:MAG: RNA polymerase sigma factor [Planctomycetota bacterium]